MRHIPNIPDLALVVIAAFACLVAGSIMSDEQTMRADTSSSGPSWDVSKYPAGWVGHGFHCVTVDTIFEGQYFFPWDLYAVYGKIDYAWLVPCPPRLAVQHPHWECLEIGRMYDVFWFRDTSNAITPPPDTLPVEQPTLMLECYPCPFRGELTIAFTAPTYPVNVSIYDVRGRLIWRRAIFRRDSALIWTPPPTLSSGIYFVRLEVGKQSITRKAVRIK